MTETAKASSNGVDANREQVESVGWARNHRALKKLDADPPPVQMVLSYRLAAAFGGDSV
jgi:hypothetical protein